MKKLVAVLITGACVALSLTSCKKDEVKLHPLVGTTIEDGIVFHVDESGDSALICSFSDIRYNRNPWSVEIIKWVSRDPQWNFFGQDTVKQYDTNWTYLSPTDSVYKDRDSSFYYGLLHANSADGRVNTALIINQKLPKNTSNKSAARYCVEYYRLTYYGQDKATALKDTTDANPWKKNQGKWWLPSLEEMRYLFDAQKKINETYAGVDGYGPLGQCYWTSTERDAKNAWYKCFSDNGVESYIPKANPTFKLPIRPVRKVAISK